MKKIFLNLFVIAGLLFVTSCSSSDDSDDGNGDGGDNITASITINGSARTFNNVVMQQSSDNRTISFSNSSEPTTVLTFTLELDAAGTDAIQELAFLENGVSYNYFYIINVEDQNPNPQDLSASVQANTDSNFIAVVSGVLSRLNNGSFESVTLTNGNFNVEY